MNRLDSNIEKIKKLITSNDYKKIDEGIEFAIKANDDKIFELLLDGTKIFIDEERSYVREDGSICYYNYPLILKMYLTSTS